MSTSGIAVSFLFPEHMVFPMIGMLEAGIFFTALRNLWALIMKIYSQVSDQGECILLVALILFVVSYCLIREVNFPPKRTHRVFIAFLCFFLFIVANFLVFGINSKVFIALIGGIIAYWRYELSKYNEIARKALSDFTEIFQHDKLTEEEIIRLRCLLMTLATFNTTNVWGETKWIVNRMIGLSSDLGFERKTPRKYDELTMIITGINKDNGVVGIVCFLPFIRCLVEDRYYKEWLDLAAEFLIQHYGISEYLSKYHRESKETYFFLDLEGGLRELVVWSESEQHFRILHDDDMLRWLFDLKGE